MITQDQINDVVDIIVKNVNPEKVILFGSYAYGEPQEDSDIDILVIKDTNSAFITQIIQNGRVLHG